MSKYLDPLDALQDARAMLRDRGRTAADRERRGVLLKRIDTILTVRGPVTTDGAEVPDLQERRRIAAQKAIGLYDFAGYPVETQGTFTAHFAGGHWLNRMRSTLLLENDRGGKLGQITAFFEIEFEQDSDKIVDCTCFRAPKGRQVGKWPTPVRRVKWRA